MKIQWLFIKIPLMFAEIEKNSKIYTEAQKTPE